MRLGLTLAALMLLLAGCGERGSVGGLVILGDQHQVEAGTTLFGDLLVLDGEVALEAGARIAGSAFVLGGDVEIAGDVDGDIAVIGGELRLADTAVVAGGLRQGGGRTHQAPGARIGSKLVSPVAVDTIIGLTRPSEQDNRLSGWLLVQLLVLAVMAALAARFLSGSLETMAGAISIQPLVPMAVGLLGLIVGISLMTFMVFTVVLIPVALLMFVGGLAGAGLGLVSLGMLAMRGLLGPAAQPRWKVSLHAALGVVSLAAALVLVSHVPLLGEVTLAAVLSTGLGTWLVTRFGTRKLVVAPA